MATKLIDPPTSPMPRKHLDAIGFLRRLGAQSRLRMGRLICSRRVRPWLGMVGVPLALACALLVGQMTVLAPLGFLAWWWSPRSWGWEWVVAVGRGLVTAEWVSVGIGGFVSFQGDRFVVALVWAGLPIAVTGASHWAKARSRT